MAITLLAREFGKGFWLIELLARGVLRLFDRNSDKTNLFVSPHNAEFLLDRPSYETTSGQSGDNT